MRRACSSSWGNAQIAAAVVVTAAAVGAAAASAGCGGAAKTSGRAGTAARSTRAGQAGQASARGGPANRRAQAESLGDPTVAATDNVRRAGYAGTAACATCHADLVRTFVQSPMHNMTRALGAAHPETIVRAPFDGADATFRFHDDVAIASAVGGERYLVVQHANPPSQTRYRLTKVIGGRVREDFVGVPVPALLREADGKPANAEVTQVTEEERVLPVSWLIAEKRWRYKGYSVMTRERPRFGEGAVWRATCIACHNTLTLLDAQAAGIANAESRAQPTRRTRRIPSPASWPDRFLPANERRALVAVDEDRLATWAAETEARVATFAESDLVELGIGCEACHAGSRAHAADPATRPSFEPLGAPYKWVDPEVARGADAKAMAVNRACSRCHQVLFSEYPWTWEGGTRTRSAGGSSTTSGEARDFLLGACAQKMDCTNCHDPHGGTARATEDAMATPAGNTRCTSCHAKYASDAALRTHAHHDPRGSGGACIACHMAKKNMGLDGHLTRYHRIGSPTDSERVLFDRPLECALCHADKSARTIVETMETWFGRRYERGPLEALYGDLDAPVLLSTLERGKAHEKAVAMELLGLARDKRALPDLLREVNEADLEPYPIVRDYARAAIERIAPGTVLAPRDRGTAVVVGHDTNED